MINRTNASSAHIGLLDSRYVNVTGDTMTGNLTMNGGNIVMSGTETVDGIDISTIPTTYLKLDASNDPITGDLLIKPTSNSTTTLQVQPSASTTPTFVVDTTNGRVGVGTVNPNSILNVASGRIVVGNTDIGNVTNGVSVLGPTSLTAVGFQAGQDTTHNMTFGWIGNSTAGSAYGYMETYGGSNDLRIMRSGSGNVLMALGSGKVGIGTTSPTSTLSFNGQAARTIALERHTTADTTGNILNIQAGGATSAATDKSGGSLALKSGISTGTGTSTILLQTPTPAGSTGTADNAFVTRITVDHTGANIDAGLIVNESGSATADFRVESDTEANMLYLDSNGDTDGTLYLGGTTNGIKVNKGGEFTLLGTATVFKDQFVDGLALKAGATDPPVFAAFSGGIWSNRFDDAAVQSAHGTLEIQHDYKNGSNLEVHIHWSPSTTNTGNCRWGFEYTVANMNATFPATTTTYAVQAGSGTVNQHQYLTVVTITGTGLTAGANIAFRIFRDGTNAADTFTGNAFLHKIAFHYEADKLGSAT